MSAMGEAVAADLARDVIRAVDLYEEVLAAGAAPLQAYLNLAVLYWDCTDPGVSGFLQLSVEFMHRAHARWDEILTEAEARNPEDTEARFWHTYMWHRTVGPELSVKEAQALLERPGATALPGFYAYLVEGGRESEEEIVRILTACRAHPTAKNRYIGALVAAGRRGDELWPPPR